MLGFSVHIQILLNFRLFDRYSTMRMLQHSISSRPFTFGHNFIHENSHTLFLILILRMVNTSVIFSGDSGFNDKFTPRKFESVDVESLSASENELYTKKELSSELISSGLNLIEKILLHSKFYTQLESAVY